MTGPRLCTVDDCGAPHFSKGYCSKHATRVRRHGDPSKARQYGGDIQARLWDRLTPDGDCWVWPIPGHNGYGRIFIDSRVQYAHRVAYETLIAPIPDGLTIDHLCRRRPCCNPWHMEPVPRSVNGTRGGIARWSSK